MFPRIASETQVLIWYQQIYITQAKSSAGQMLLSVLPSGSEIRVCCRLDCFQKGAESLLIPSERRADIQHCRCSFMMPKMKQLGYSIYELSKMQNGWTVRELMLFPKHTAAHLDLSPSE